MQNAFTKTNKRAQKNGNLNKNKVSKCVNESLQKTATKSSPTQNAQKIKEQNSKMKPGFKLHVSVCKKKIDAFVSIIYQSKDTFVSFACSYKFANCFLMDFHLFYLIDSLLDKRKYFKYAGVNTTKAKLFLFFLSFSLIFCLIFLGLSMKIVVVM